MFQVAATRLYAPVAFYGRTLQQCRTMSVKTAKKTESRGGVLGWGKKNPFAFQVIIATVKTSLSDLVVQKTIEGKKWEEIDLKRNLVFVAFGAVYLGWAQYLIYVHGFRAIFGSRMDKFAALPFGKKLRDFDGLKALAGQVALDVGVITPLIYYPVFYVFKESVQGDTGVEASQRGATDIINAAFTKYTSNAKEDVVTFAKLWIPGDLVIYSFPIWLRLPLNHGLSFVWTCILSVMRGESGKIDNPNPKTVLEDEEREKVH